MCSAHTPGHENAFWTSWIVVKPDTGRGTETTQNTIVRMWEMMGSGCCVLVKCAVCCAVCCVCVWIDLRTFPVVCVCVWVLCAVCCVLCVEC